MPSDNDGDDGRDQERRELHSKLAFVLKKAKILRNTINSDPFLSAAQKTALINRIGAATAFTSGIVDHQDEDILNFKDSISDAQSRFTFIENQVKEAKQVNELQAAKEELDFYCINHYLNDFNQIENSKLYDILTDKNKSLDERLQTINTSLRYQAIKESNNKTREMSAQKAVSTALTEIEAYITTREGKGKKPSDLRQNKLDIARRMKAELEKEETTATQKIQAVNSILKDEGKIFSQRGNVFKHGAENFLVRVQGFLKNNKVKNPLPSYFFAPPRAATLQKSLESLLLFVYF